MNQDTKADEVKLTIPAQADFVRLARLTCSAVATRLGLAYDDVEDVRIAVGEACALLIAISAESSILEIAVTVETDRLNFTLTVPVATGAVADIETDLSEQILNAVADGHQIRLEEGIVRLTKRDPGRVEAATGP